MSETYDPAALIAATGDSLRGCARQLDIDPAMFYRPWSELQADRYATRLGKHPWEIWPQWWAHVVNRSPSWRDLAAARIAALDGSGRALRLGALLTVAEAAAAIGVKPSRLRQWEAGTNRPTGVAGERYAAFLAELEVVAAEHRARLDGQRPDATVAAGCNEPSTPTSSAPTPSASSPRSARPKLHAVPASLPAPSPAGEAATA